MSEYLSCAETAKLVRVALKKAFPGVKFSVRSSTYAGGASMRVGWMDGPSGKAVEAVVSPYKGGGFDGMIDMKYNVSSWLMPDGSAYFASSPGTSGSMGVYDPYSHEAPGPGARKVRFGSDFIFTEREYSLATYTAAVESVCADWGFPMPVIKQSDVRSTPYIENGWSLKVPNASQDLQTLVHRTLQEAV